MCPSEITMCDTRSCAIREKCWRFMAPPAMYQSWAHWESKKGKCDGFMEIKSGKHNSAVNRRPTRRDKAG